MCRKGIGCKTTYPGPLVVCDSLSISILFCKDVTLKTLCSYFISLENRDDQVDAVALWGIISMGGHPKWKQPKFSTLLPLPSVAGGLAYN